MDTTQHQHSWVEGHERALIWEAAITSCEDALWFWDILCKAIDVNQYIREMYHAD